MDDSVITSNSPQNACAVKFLIIQLYQSSYFFKSTSGIAKSFLVIWGDGEARRFSTEHGISLFGRNKSGHEPK